ncbi:MAG: serine hydrolase [Candidatus Dormibacteria bacterium]
MRSRAAANSGLSGDTRFHIGSNTKQVTAAAIMLLRERTGLLRPATDRR